MNQIKNKPDGGVKAKQRVPSPAPVKGNKPKNFPKIEKKKEVAELKKPV